MTDDMKIPPAESVGEADRIRRDFADGVRAENVTPGAVAADIDEGLGAPVGVEGVARRPEHPMAAKPPVNDQDFDRPVADLPVRYHVEAPSLGSSLIRCRR
jgi:hypothetical protein